MRRLAERERERLKLILCGARPNFLTSAILVSVLQSCPCQRCVYHAVCRQKQCGTRWQRKEGREGKPFLVGLSSTGKNIRKVKPKTSETMLGNLSLVWRAGEGE